MKAITIWQPWAEFVAAGVKHNETRSWATKYRGPIAIHAAVKPIRQVVPLLSEKAFLNDPSSLVAQAFAEIYPGTEYEAILVDKITTEDGTEMVGCTTFPDDGTLPLIEVAGHIPAEAVPEILAHELAHIVTVGDEHGPEWKKAFEAIYSKYNELAIARFGAQEPEENQKGGD